MEHIVSQLNGIQMNRHPGISDENWKKTKAQLQNTEGARLFKVGQPAQPQAAQAASGASFGMPQSGEWVAEADKKKLDKRTKEGKAAAGESNEVE